jgi:signal transduction histidine kinase
MLEDGILLDTFTSALCKMIPVILLILGVGGYWLGRRALRPINSLITEAQKISTSDLSRRLPVPAAHDELRQLAIEWNSLLARIQTTLSRITQFTADASHELRSPIAYIRTTAEYSLENPGLDEETREALLEIVDETRSTSDMLDNLLTLARADAGYVLVEVEESSVEPAIQEVCARFAPLARAKQQSLHWEIADDVSPVLRMNSFHLRRLLTILLDNAIKFTGAGGNIVVRYDTAAGARLQVTDDGIGIAAGDLPKVFDRFYRVDAARSDTRDGVGLGLSIAKWIAELYLGDITIESKAAQGTVVTFHLPGPTVLDRSETLIRP